MRPVRSRRAVRARSPRSHDAAARRERRASAATGSGPGATSTAQLRHGTPAGTVNATGSITTPHNARYRPNTLPARRSSAATSCSIPSSTAVIGAVSPAAVVLGSARREEPASSGAEGPAALGAATVSCSRDGGGKPGRGGPPGILDMGRTPRNSKAGLCDPRLGRCSNTGRGSFRLANIPNIR